MPNNDLISRKALLDELSRDIDFERESNVPITAIAAFKIAVKRAKSLPAVDAEPVRHGQWVNPHMNKYGHPCHNCSECGFQASQKDRNYCPNCGAKMENPT